MQFVTSYGATTASLACVDFLSLAEEFNDLQIVCCFCCVFSHDLSFENGSVISLTNDAIKLRREHGNGFSILTGCLYCITVSFSFAISYFSVF